MSKKYALDHSLTLERAIEGIYREVEGYTNEAPNEGFL